MGNSDARATLAEISAQCGSGFMPPSVSDTKVFEEPWQASAFALTVALHQRGLFSWPEWAATLGQHLARNPDDGRRYYEHWLAALEDMMTRLRLVNPQELALCQQAWVEAAERTPHGQPIEL